MNQALSMVAVIAHYALNIYSFVVLAAVFMTWLKPNPANPAVQFIRSITEPVFNQVRRIMPRFFFSSGMDFTPVVVILLIMLLDKVVMRMMLRLAMSRVSS